MGAPECDLCGWPLPLPGTPLPPLLRAARQSWLVLPSHSHSRLVGYNLVTCEEVSKSLSLVAFTILKNSILFLFLKDLRFVVG